MLTVNVPATSANIGAGFDSCGLALALYNRVQMEEWDDVCITSLDGTRVPTGPQNLVYSTAKSLYDECGVPLRGLRLAQENGVPMARGLGSSSACIAAGLVGANELLGRPYTRMQLLERAAALEGHPDNVAPAMLGGFVTSALEGGHLYAVQKPVADTLCFAAFVPGYKLLTRKARAALPKTVSHKAAVYNVSRAALLAAAFCEERYDLLRVATCDKLHQPYRAALMPGMEEVFALCAELGALGWWVSGAGPTLMCAVHTENKAFFSGAQQALDAAEKGSPLAAYRLHRLAPDNTGAFVTA